MLVLLVIVGVICLFQLLLLLVFFSVSLLVVVALFLTFLYLFTSYFTYFLRRSSFVTLIFYYYLFFITYKNRESYCCCCCRFFFCLCVSDVVCAFFFVALLNSLAIIQILHPTFSSGYTCMQACTYTVLYMMHADCVSVQNEQKALYVYASYCCCYYSTRNKNIYMVSRKKTAYLQVTKTAPTRKNSETQIMCTHT